MPTALSKSCYFFYLTACLSLPYLTCNIEYSYQSGILLLVIAKCLLLLCAFLAYELFTGLNRGRTRRIILVFTILKPPYLFQTETDRSENHWFSLYNNCLIGSIWFFVFSLFLGRAFHLWRNVLNVCSLLPQSRFVKMHLKWMASGHQLGSKRWSQVCINSDSSRANN